MKFFILISILLLSFFVKAEVVALNRQGLYIKTKNFNFTDEAGKKVNLSTFFQPKKPVFLAPVYFECPGVCTLTLNQLFSDLKKLKFNPGKAVEVVIFSINAKETPELALEKKMTYLKRYAYENFPQGFHFLVGEQDQISELTEELGFKYEKNGEQFSHPGVVYLMTPEGKISKQLNSKETSLKKLHEYVFQAANGRKLSSFEKMVLACQVPKEAEKHGIIFDFFKSTLATHRFLFNQ